MTQRHRPDDPQENSDHTRAVPVVRHSSDETLVTRTETIAVGSESQLAWSNEPEAHCFVDMNSDSVAAPDRMPPFSSQDAAFLRSLNAAWMRYPNSGVNRVIPIAQNVCADLGQGESPGQIANNIHCQNPTTSSLDESKTIVTFAAETRCPTASANAASPTPEPKFTANDFKLLNAMRRNGPAFFTSLTDTDARLICGDLQRGLPTTDMQDKMSAASNEDFTWFEDTATPTYCPQLEGDG